PGGDGAAAPAAGHTGHGGVPGGAAGRAARRRRRNPRGGDRDGPAALGAVRPAGGADRGEARLPAGRGSRGHVTPHRILVAHGTRDRHGQATVTEIALALAARVGAVRTAYVDVLAPGRGRCSPTRRAPRWWSPLSWHRATTSTPTCRRGSPRAATGASPSPGRWGPTRCWPRSCAPGCSR